MNLPELQAQVRQIEIRTRRLVSDLMIGQYQSVFKGQGMDFDDIREYQPGDEVRHIDWNVTARLNQPFIKQYVEERELTVMLVVDLSASGTLERPPNQARTGRRSRRRARLCRPAQQRQGWPHALYRACEKYVTPPGNRHVLRVVRDILGHTPDHRGGDLRHALQHLQKSFRRRSVMVLLSDFLDPLPISTLQQARRRHDVVAIQITDPHEEQLPALGRITLEDAESGEVGEVTLRNGEEIDAFFRQRAEAQDQLEQQFNGLGIDHIRLRTNEPFVPELGRFFRTRLERQRRT